MTDPTTTTGPQCPAVPPELIYEWCRRSATTIGQDLQDAAQWGFGQGIAAAQRLAAEERQRGVHSPEAQQFWTDAELHACSTWVEAEYGSVAAAQLRAARRPKPPTLREQALAALRERLSNDSVVSWTLDRQALRRALQALEAGDE